MSDLRRFVEAELNEDERVARATIPRPALAHRPGVWRVVGECVIEGDEMTIHDEGGHGAEEAEHIARHDPARVLADVEATRAILAEHHNVNDGDCSTCVVGLWGYPTHGGSVIARWPCPTVRLIASRWADRPGYRPEWELVSDTTEETPQ